MMTEDNDVYLINYLTFSAPFKIQANCRTHSSISKRDKYDNNLPTIRNKFLNNSWLIFS